MIVNLTHNLDGSVRLRRSVTTKLAIGLPPDAGGNYPKKLDHFVFQKKGAAQVEFQPEHGPKKKRTEVVWLLDEDLQRKYGDHCKEVWIILLDDDPDVVFRTELAWWTKTQRFCSGDGEKALRKNAERPELPPAPHLPCANHGCKDWAAGKCKPSGDLYFLLADAPSLGTICKLHTTSFQSVSEIRSALEDLRSVTGGRLMGLRVKLTVRLEANRFKDKSKGGAITTSTKYVLGLELAASDVLALTTSLTESALLFESVKKRLGSRSVVIDEDPDTETAPSLSAEFYPAESIAPAPAVQGTIVPATTPIPAQHPDMLPWPRTDAAEFYKRWKDSGHSESDVRYFLQHMCGVDSSLKVPMLRRAKALEWAGTKRKPEPQAEISKAEADCRNVMGLLALNLTEQAEIIDMSGGDWNKVKAELDFIANERDRG